MLPLDHQHSRYAVKNFEFSNKSRASSPYGRQSPSFDTVCACVGYMDRCDALTRLQITASQIISPGPGKKGQR
jgi:hypothetical protein